MSAGTCTSFFLIVCFLVCSSEAQEKITAEVGQDVILPCKASKNILITAVEWSRPEMEPEYVLFYRDGRLDPHSQHPSYQNRVDLQDKEMKDGDFSLILKNVKMEDTGRYVCWVYQRKKFEPISNITDLVVLEPGDKGGITGDGGDKDGIIAGSVGGVILLLAVAALGFVIYRRHMRQNPNLPVPPDEAAAIEMLPVPEQHQNKPDLV